MDIHHQIEQVESFNLQMMEAGENGLWDTTLNLAKQRQMVLNQLFVILKNTHAQHLIDDVSTMAQKIFATDETLEKMTEKTKENSIGKIIKLKIGKKAANAYQQVASK